MCARGRYDLPHGSNHAASAWRYGLRLATKFSMSKCAVVRCALWVRPRFSWWARKRICLWLWANVGKDHSCVAVPSSIESEHEHTDPDRSATADGAGCRVFTHAK